MGRDIVAHPRPIADRRFLGKDARLVAAEDFILPRLFVTAELRVLPDLQVRVRAKQELIGQRYVERGATIPLPGNAGKTGSSWLNSTFAKSATTLGSFGLPVNEASGTPPPV